LPIGDYALRSDCRTAALVSLAGSVDWLCCPRFDALAVFARLLDPDGGHFAIRPAGDFQASRAYVDQTMVLETTFGTQAGTAVLTDAIPGAATTAATWAPGRREFYCDDSRAPSGKSQAPRGLATGVANTPRPPASTPSAASRRASTGPGRCSGRPRRWSS
jgi:hypothetical protein